jgi:glycosyltransferase involved in cell wall biosynthesis
VQWLGWRDHDEVIALMQRAGALVFPSEVYEGGTPMSIVEALACGLPVLASDRGAMQSMVADGDVGYRFEPGNADALARAAHLLFHQDHVREAMRHRARTEFVSTYAPDVNLHRLVAIYHDALRTRRAA